MYKSKYTGAQVDALLADIANKQPKLTAGAGISITGNTISVTLDTSLFKIVSALPTANIESNKIYLLPSGTSGSSNIYTEYLYVNNKWEILGQYKSDVDLSDYVTTTKHNTDINSINQEISSIKSSNTTINSSISDLNTRVNSLNEKLGLIASDPDYEVVLFKKQA